MNEEKEIKMKHKKKLLSYCCKEMCYTEHANSNQHRCTECDKKCIAYNLTEKTHGERYTCKRNNPAFELIEKSYYESIPLLFDHCRTGWDRSGRPIVEGNPYGLSSSKSSQLAHFVELAKELGYIYTIDSPASNYHDDTVRVSFAKVNVNNSTYQNFYAQTSQATGLIFNVNGTSKVRTPRCNLCGLNINPTSKNAKYCDRDWCGVPEILHAWYDFECARCSNDLTLDVHHLDKNKSQSHKKDFLELCKRFIVLCPTCHFAHHRNKLDKEELLTHHKPLPQKQRERKEKLAQYAKENYGDIQ